MSLAHLIPFLAVFLLAIFVGFEIITKVPPTLHTPLMSGSNAISGITVVGAIIAAARRQASLNSPTSGPHDPRPLDNGRVE